MSLKQMIVEQAEPKEMKTVEVMPLLRFTDEMLADETKHEFTFSELLELFSKIEEKEIEVVDDEAVEDTENTPYSTY